MDDSGKNNPYEAGMSAQVSDASFGFAEPGQAVVLRLAWAERQLLARAVPVMRTASAVFAANGVIGIYSAVALIVQTSDPRYGLLFAAPLKVSAGVAALGGFAALALSYTCWSFATHVKTVAADCTGDMSRFARRFYQLMWLILATSATNILAWTSQLVISIAMRALGASAS
jgi:hypothetical protein